MISKKTLTSDYAHKTSGSRNVNDEIHIILVDEDGDWSELKMLEVLIEL